MFHAELKILLKVVAKRRNATGIVEIIRLEAGEDHFIFVAVPNKRAENGVRFAEFVEEIKSQCDVFRRAEHRIAKNDINEPLTEFALWNPGAGIVRPDERIGFGELGFALI